MKKGLNSYKIEILQFLLLVILFVFTIGLIIFAYIQKQYDAGVK